MIHKCHIDRKVCACCRHWTGSVSATSLANGKRSYNVSDDLSLCKGVESNFYNKKRKYDNSCVKHEFK